MAAEALAAFHKGEDSEEAEVGSLLLAEFLANVRNIARLFRK